MSDDIISKEIQKKVQSDGGSDYVRIKDDNGKIRINKKNPFVGRLLKHEYVDADNPRYGNDEGKKHKLTWLTRENGEKVKKKQSTTSSWFMQKLIDAHKESDSWDMKWWYEQRGPKKTVPHVEPYSPNELKEEMPEEEEDSGSPHDFQAGKDPDEAEDIDVSDLPF